MRAPSSLYSTDASPVISSAAVVVAAVAASIGSTGRPTCSPTDSRSSALPVRAMRAVSPRSPDNIAARRTTAAGRSEARAIASRSTPDRAPVRSSPSIARTRKSHSEAVARAARSTRMPVRAAAEPEPEVVASTSSAASTSPTLSEGSSACVMSRAVSPRHPTPSRPCRGEASSSPISAGSSDASARASSSARASILASLDDVAPTRSAVVTSSASIIWAFSHRRPTSVPVGHDVPSPR